MRPHHHDHDNGAGERLSIVKDCTPCPLIWKENRIISVTIWVVDYPLGTHWYELGGLRSIGKNAIIRFRGKPLIKGSKWTAFWGSVLSRRSSLVPCFCMWVCLRERESLGVFIPFEFVPRQECANERKARQDDKCFCVPLCSILGASMTRTNFSWTPRTNEARNVEMVLS